MRNLSLKNKKILITGITGFVGSALAVKLEKQGAKVYGISKSQGAKNIFKTNITNYKNLEEIITKKRIEIVFHLAGEALVESGQDRPYDTFKVNTEGTLNLLELARIHKLEKIIIASSAHVYGKNNMLPYKEFFAPKPSRPYETSKACTDMIAQSYADTFDMPIRIGRFVNIYGPGDTNFTRLIPKTIRAVLKNENPEMWGGDALRDYLYLEDAIDGYIQLARVSNKSIKRNKVFNFGAHNTYTVRDVIESIIRISDKPVRIKKIEDKRELEIKEQHVSSLKAKRLLDWQAKTDLDEGLKKTITWYKNYFNLHNK